MKKKQAILSKKRPARQNTPLQMGLIASSQPPIHQEDPYLGSLASLIEGLGKKGKIQTEPNYASEPRESQIKTEKKIKPPTW